MDKFYLLVWLYSGHVATTIPEPYYSQEECRAAGLETNFGFSCVRAPKLTITKKEPKVTLENAPCVMGSTISGRVVPCGSEQ